MYRKNMVYPIRVKVLIQFSLGQNIIGSVENLVLRFWLKKKLQKVFCPPWHQENKAVSIFISLSDSPPVDWVPKYNKCFFNHQHKTSTLKTHRESTLN